MNREACDWSVSNRTGYPIYGGRRGPPRPRVVYGPHHCSCRAPVCPIRILKNPSTEMPWGGKGGVYACYMRQSCRDEHRTAAVATAVVTATVGATVATATTVNALPPLCSIACLWHLPLPSPPSHRSPTIAGSAFTPRHCEAASPSPWSSPD